MLAGLGAGLAETGALSDRSQERALAALRRYRLLIDHMGVKRVQVVATAAARDARNGAEFVAQIKRIGFDCEVLSPAEEARLAGEGVLSAIPGADGIVGDLGGGSLELAEVGGDAVGTRDLVAARRAARRRRRAASGRSRETLARRAEGKRAGQGQRRPAVLHGRRVVARAGPDRHDRTRLSAAGHGTNMRCRRRAPRNCARWSARSTSSSDKAIAPARLATSPVAAMILPSSSSKLQPSELVLSSFGIREGLLYAARQGGARRIR